MPALDAERASFSTRVRLRGSRNDRQGRVPSRPSEAVASNSLLMLCPARCKTGFATTDRRCHGARLCPAFTQPASDSVIPRLLACLEPGGEPRAATLGRVDGDHYAVLTPAADALSGTPRGDASATGNDRLLIKEQPLQPIPVRCAPSDRLLEPGIGDRGFWEVRTTRCLRSQASSRTSEEELVLEFG